MTQQVTAAIVISQATVSPPGGYASGSRDDLIQGQTITLTNLDDTDVIAWSWEITPATGRELADYGVTGSSGASCSLTPPASPDGWGDAHVKLTVTGPKLSTGAINQRTVAVILGIRQPSNDYAAGVPLPSPLESDRGGLVVAQDGKGWRDRVGEALFALNGQVFGARQSHADAVLWYKLATGSSSQPSSGTTTTALTVSGTARAQIPGPFGECVRAAADMGLAGAAAVGLGSGSCTIWAWILPDLATDSSHIWGRYQTSDGELRFSLDTDAGIPALTAIGDSTQTVTGTYPLVGGVPNLLVGIYDESESKLSLVVNGLEYDSVSLSGAIHWTNETPGQVVWGCGYSAHTNPCAGLILELGADSRAYDLTELDEMLRRGRGWRS